MGIIFFDSLNKDDWVETIKTLLVFGLPFSCLVNHSVYPSYLAEAFDTTSARLFIKESFITKWLWIYLSQLRRALYGLKFYSYIWAISQPQLQLAGQALFWTASVTHHISNIKILDF